jgi:hypothetical protein
MNLSADSEGLLLMPGGETRDVYVLYVSGENRRIRVVWGKHAAGASLVSASSN